MFGRRIFIDVWITVFMSLTLLFFALANGIRSGGGSVSC